MSTLTYVSDYTPGDVYYTILISSKSEKDQIDRDIDLDKISPDPDMILIKQNYERIIDTYIAPKLGLTKTVTNAQQLVYTRGEGAEKVTMTAFVTSFEVHMSSGIMIVFECTNSQTLQEIKNNYETLIFKAFANESKKIKIGPTVENKAKFAALKDTPGLKNLDPAYSPVKAIGQMSGIVPKVKGVDVGQGRKSRKIRKSRSRKLKKTRKH